MGKCVAALSRGVGRIWEGRAARVEALTVWDGSSPLAHAVLLHSGLLVSSS